MKRITLPAAGLATDPNPLLTAAQGAMRVADNVVVVSDGAVTVRPGFAIDTVKASTTFRPRAMEVFRGEPIAVSTDGTAWRIESTSAVYTGNAEPPNEPLSRTQFAEARGSLYYTTSTGVRKIPDTSATDTLPAGIEMLAAFQDPGNATPGPVTAAGQVGLRIVFVRRDVNGYVVRSEPSARVVKMDAALGPGFFDWGTDRAKVFIPAWVQENDTLELYRTRASGLVSVGPTPEFYLATSYVVTSGDVAAGFCRIPDDRVPDDSLGASLYTNPSQLGIAGSKTPPPTCVALAWWSACMWFGNTIEPHRLQVQITDAGNTTATTTGILWRSSLLNVTFTAGSADLTGIVSVAGLVPGMAISGPGNFQDPVAPGTYIPGGTYIGAISGAGPYTVSMVDSDGLPVTSSGSVAGESVAFHDVVAVNGVEFYAANTQYTPGSSFTDERTFFIDLSATVTEASLVSIAEALCQAINAWSAVDPAFGVRARNLGDVTNPVGTFAPGSILLEEIGSGVASAPFTFQSVTKPNAVMPVGSLLTATRDVSPARLFWSDPDEPESVPLVQYVDVGNTAEPILALVPLRSSLLVFKRDGIFRLTGSAPDGWSVELLDASTRLLYGSAVDVMDDRAYALTNRGAVRVTESGVETISERLIGRMMLPAQRAVFTLGSGVVCAWPSAGVVAFCLPDQGGNQEIDSWFCFRPSGGTWTRWRIPASAVASDHRSASMYYARPDAWEIRANHAALEPIGESGYDHAHTLSGWTYTASVPSVSVTDAQRGTWEPKAGDWVSARVGGGTRQMRKVLAVADGVNEFMVAIKILTLSSPFVGTPTTARIGYEAIPAVMHWQAHSVDSISSALYREVQLLTDLSADEVGTLTTDALFDATGAQFDVGMSSDTTRTPATVSVSEARSTSAPHSTLMRAMMPREVARVTHAYPYAAGTNIQLPWVCLGVALVFEPVSERNSR